ncbi:MAG: oligosaccharide flippase family protein [Deferribacteraceae bacterium]|jgi:O-antigen/teichoic acid export membrane protein|nr:oligosaccharide flippase family protein [Deferribacteraceae bacterium]
MSRNLKNTETKIKEQSIAGRLVTLLKDSVIYGILMALSKFAILLILPITTRYLSTDGYGALDTIMLTGALLTIIMIAGQDEAFGRFYYDKTDEEDRKTLLMSALVIVIMICIICAAAIYFFSSAILTALFGGTEHLREFRLMLIYAPITALINFYRSVMRWTFRKKEFFVLNIGPTSMIFILTYIFIVILKLGIAGAIYAQIISNSIFILVAVFLSRDDFTLKIDGEILASLLKYGLPCMMMVAFTSLIPVIDKGMYTRFFGAETLGLYSFASRYAMFISLPLTAFHAAWGPMLFTTYNEDNANQTIQNVIVLYVALFSAMLYAQIAIAEPITALIASKRYLPGIYFALPLSLSIIMDVFSSVTAAGTDISKKMYLNTISIIAGIALMFVTIYPFVKFFGAIGIAYCTLTGRLFSHMLRTAASYRAHMFRNKLTRSYITLLLTFVLSFFCQRLPIQNLPLIITVRSAFFLLLLAIIWVILLPEEAKKVLLNKYLTRIMPNFILCRL